MVRLDCIFTNVGVYSNLNDIEDIWWNGFGSNKIILKWIFDNNYLDKFDGFFGQYPIAKDLNINIEKWNKLFIDSDEKINNQIEILKKYIDDFDNFPKELLCELENII